MALEDEIRAIAERIPNLKARLATEEATKQALVLPFLQALGYNVFDPTEVEPEYNADFGETKGWKADYALKFDGQPVIIIECKVISNNLVGVVPQLGRYFPHTNARIGVLTNGIIYKFFTDQEETNRMDQAPFWEVDLESLTDRDLDQLGKFVKGSDVSEAVTAASRLKYIARMKQKLSQQYHHQPDDDFAEWLARPFLPARSRMTPEIKTMAQEAFREFVEELVTGFLRGNQPHTSATEEEMTSEEISSEESDVSVEESNEEGGNSEPTEDESAGYEIVKAIVGEVVDSADRVTIRDAQQYCAVFLDDNNRRPLCRLHFNRAQKYIGLFDGSRHSTTNALLETRYAIESLQDIHNYADQLRETARRYLEA